MAKVESSPLVSVLVVSYRSRHFLRDCFSAVFRSSYSPLEVVLFDSASGDGSVDFTRSAFPDVRVIPSGDNPGFTGACNRAIPQLRGRYVFLLNPDTVVDPRCIELLVEEMERDPAVGICGAKMLFGWEPRVLNSVGHRVNRIYWGWDRGCFELDRGQYDGAREVPSVCGGAALYRRSLFAELGPFDGRLFMYTEDVDYGLRANLAGHRVIVNPAARVYHWINLRVSNPRHHEFQEHRYRMRILLKSCPAEVLRSRLKEAVIFDCASIRDRIRSGDWVKAYYRLMALLWNVALLPDTLRERRRVQGRRSVSLEDFENLLVAGAGYPVFDAPAPDYEFVRDDRVRARVVPSSFTVGEGEERCLGLGWHGRESLDGRPCRRMGLYGILYLGGEGAGSRFLARLQLHGGRSTVVRLNLNDGAAGDIELGSDGWQTVDFPAETEKGVVKIFLSVDGPGRAVALGGASLLPRGNA